jgi:outer membrane protein TolC
MIQDHPHRAGTDLGGIGWGSLRHGSILSRVGASGKPGAVQTTQASAIAVELRRATFAHAIAILSGRPPSEITLPCGQLAARPPAVPASVPSALLERRSDVAQAERLVQAQSARIGVAVAAFHPSVSLSASGGLSGDPTAALFAAENQF